MLQPASCRGAPPALPLILYAAMYLLTVLSIELVDCLNTDKGLECIRYYIFVPFSVSGARAGVSIVLEPHMADITLVKEVLGAYMPAERAHMWCVAFVPSRCKDLTYDICCVALRALPSTEYLLCSIISAAHLIS